MFTVHITMFNVKALFIIHFETIINFIINNKYG